MQTTDRRLIITIGTSKQSIMALDSDSIIKGQFAQSLEFNMYSQIMSTLSTISLK